MLTAVIAAIAGAFYYPQAGIINPAELAPIASIYLAVWVAIGGRGRLYGAVIGAAQGYWIAYWRIPSFIVTLAGMLVFLVNLILNALMVRDGGLAKIA